MGFVFYRGDSYIELAGGVFDGDDFSNALAVTEVGRGTSVVSGSCVRGGGNFIFSTKKDLLEILSRFDKYFDNSTTMMDGFFEGDFYRKVSTEEMVRLNLCNELWLRFDNSDGAVIPIFWYEVPLRIGEGNDLREENFAGFSFSMRGYDRDVLELAYQLTNFPVDKNVRSFIHSKIASD